jgi:HK97 family phage portal protein
MANLIDRFRFAWRLSRMGGVDRKSAELAFVPTWKKTTWRDLDFARARDEGYNVNAAVAACIRALTFAFPEPRPLVLDQDEERVANHPLQALLDRPNPSMSHSELLVFIITYMAVGGNCYLHKVRGRGNQVVELWPYHDGHFTPAPGGKNWIDHYVYTVNGRDQRVEATDIVHLKWPMPDLSQPWIALPPLRQVAREVDTDSELTRMLHTILINDVPIRTVIELPAGTNLSDDEYNLFMARFMGRHSGSGRGLPAVVEGTNRVTKLGLNLAELDLTSLRGVPESRICAAYGVPPEVAMLSVGQAHSTENNLYAADVRFTTRTLTPLWSLVGGELTQDLTPEFSGSNLRVAYDVASIQALKKDEVATWTRVINGYDRDLITKNEARAEMGLVAIGSLNRSDPGDVFISDVTPPPQIIDAIVEPRQLTDEQKSLQRKAPDRRTQIQQQMEREVAAVLQADYEQAV